MHIGIDGACWSNRRGYGRFLRELLEALATEDRENRYTIFFDSGVSADFHFADRFRSVAVGTGVAVSEAASVNGRRSVPDLLRMSRAVARERPDRVPAPDSGRGIRLVLVDSFALDLWHQFVRFDEADTNHDEQVDSRELTDALARATSEAPSRLVADLVIDALDTDHDRQISRRESDQARSSRRPPRGGQTP